MGLQEHQPDSILPREDSHSCNEQQWHPWRGACARRPRVHGAVTAALVVPACPHVSGPAYDLTFCEVRNTSLVLLWKAPVYSGSSPVSGYFVDYKEGEAEEWVTVNEGATANRYLKVSVPSLSVAFARAGSSENLGWRFQLGHSGPCVVPTELRLWGPGGPACPARRAQSRRGTQACAQAALCALWGRLVLSMPLHVRPLI